jgi:hypothetical protein
MSQIVHMCLRKAIRVTTAALILRAQGKLAAAAAAAAAAATATAPPARGKVS